MVAITVILAAVIGTFVLDLGQNVGGSNAPQATFQFEQNDSAGNTDAMLEVRHAGGETLDENNIEIRVAGTPSDDTEQFQGPISAGNSTEVSIGSSVSAAAGDKVTVVWISPSTDKTAILAEHTLS